MMRLTTLFSLFILSIAVALAGPHRYSSNIQGDVNADGEVNIADVNVLVDDILGHIGNTKCDLNKDGEINIADINAVINMILSGER